MSLDYESWGGLGWSTFSAALTFVLTFGIVWVVK